MLGKRSTSDFILAGRYRILHPLGRGGTSVVWLAEKAGAGPRHPRKSGYSGLVAVKIPEVKAGSPLVRQEAGLLASLRNPGIPEFVEYLEVETSEIDRMNRMAHSSCLSGISDRADGAPGQMQECDAGGGEMPSYNEISAAADRDQEMEPDRETVPCLVMEYIRGRSLRNILDGEPAGHCSRKQSGSPAAGESAAAGDRASGESVRSRKLSLRQTAKIGVAVCEILEYLHGRNPPVFYRDIKPANLMCRRDGSVVLLDIGSAAGIGMGTRGYAAPELYGSHECRHDSAAAGEIPGKGQRFTAGSDLYSLGAVLHECLTGIPPAQSGLRPLGDTDPAYAGSLMENILACCCSVSVSVRWADAASLRRQLETVIYEDRSRRLLPWDIMPEDPEKVLLHFRRSVRAACMLAFIAFAFTAAGKCLYICGYTGLLQKAHNADALAEKTEDYREAAQLSPADSDAYERFLEEITGDGVLMPGEQEAFDSVMCQEVRMRKGAQTCGEVLMEESPEQYEKLLLLAGRRCYACRQYGSRTRQYLLPAADGSMLSAAERKSAQLLAEMSEIMERGIAADDQAGAGKYVQAPVDVRRAWEVMTQIEDDADRMAKSGREDTTVAAVYRDLGGILGLYGAVLLDSGVPAGEMERMAGRGRAFLDEAALSRKDVPELLLGQLQSATEEAERVLNGIKEAER